MPYDTPYNRKLAKEINHLDWNLIHRLSAQSHDNLMEGGAIFSDRFLQGSHHHAHLLKKIAHVIKGHGLDLGLPMPPDLESHVSQSVASVPPVSNADGGITDIEGSGHHHLFGIGENGERLEEVYGGIGNPFKGLANFLGLRRRGRVHIHAPEEPEATADQILGHDHHRRRQAFPEERADSDEEEEPPALPPPRLLPRARSETVHHRPVTRDPTYADLQHAVYAVPHRDRANTIVHRPEPISQTRAEALNEPTIYAAIQHYPHEPVYSVSTHHRHPHNPSGSGTSGSGFLDDIGKVLSVGQHFLPLLGLGEPDHLEGSGFLSELAGMFGLGEHGEGEHGDEHMNGSGVLSSLASILGLGEPEHAEGSGFLSDIAGMFGLGEPEHLKGSGFLSDIAGMFGLGDRAVMRNFHRGVHRHHLHKRLMSHPHTHEVLRKLHGLGFTKHKHSGRYIHRGMGASLYPEHVAELAHLGAHRLDGAGFFDFLSKGLSSATKFIPSLLGHVGKTVSKVAPHIMSGIKTAAPLLKPLAKMGVNMIPGVGPILAQVMEHAPAAIKTASSLLSGIDNKYAQKAGDFFGKTSGVLKNLGVGGNSAGIAGGSVLGGPYNDPINNHRQNIGLGISGGSTYEGQSLGTGMSGAAKKRGRPKKVRAGNEITTIGDGNKINPLHIKRGRGRPRKTKGSGIISDIAGMFGLGEEGKDTGKGVSGSATYEGCGHKKSHHKKVKGGELKQLLHSSSMSGMGHKKGKDDKVDKAPSGIAGGDGRKDRAVIVKKVMLEKGLKMIEASKYVKEHGLYKKK